MPTPNPSVVTVLERFRAEQDKQAEAVLRQLGSAYTQLYRRLSDKIELEARRIFEHGGETVSRLWIQQRLSSLRDDLEKEIKKYSNFLETTIDANTLDALTLGSEQAMQLMKLGTLGQKSLIGISFGKLNASQIDTMIAFLSKGSPLRDRIEQMAGFYTNNVVDQLTESIALGYNPYKTANNIKGFLVNVMNTANTSMASVLATAVRTARTAQLWTLREATRANYQANSDVVTGWQWVSSKDPDTCPACISMDGTVHELDEALDGHPNCRCYPIPVILGNTINPETSGLDYFNSLTDAQQKDMLGANAYQAYKDGKFNFNDLNKQVADEVYGSFRVVPSLKDLIGE